MPVDGAPPARADVESVTADLADLPDLPALVAALGLDDRTATQLAQFDALMLEANAAFNLIAPGSVPPRWHRHYADSAQLFPLLPPHARSLLDIGAGAGFPGLILGIMATTTRPDLVVTLAESIGKKASFLRRAVDALGLSCVSVHADRAELFHVERRSFDVITARAVTALPRLLDLATPMLASNGVLIFPKGARAEEELTAAASGWTFNLTQVPSRTDAAAQILILREVRRRR